MMSNRESFVNCASCVFYSVPFCKRMPPQIVWNVPEKSFSIAFPAVPETEICGEYKPDQATHKKMLQRAAFAGMPIVGGNGQ